MQGDQGQAEQKLIFDQLQKVKSLLMDQQVFFAFIVLRLGNLLALHKSETSFDHQFVHRRGQTALTSQRQSGLRRQLQPQLNRLGGKTAPLDPDAPGNRLGWGAGEVKIAPQTGKIRGVDPTAEFAGTSG
jgi:hypothetical protein